MSKTMLRSLRFVFASLLIAAAVSISICSANASIPKFDAVESFGFLEEQCDFGPRPVGSDAHERTLKYLADELKPYADTVGIQKFTFTRGGHRYNLANVIARFGKWNTPAILLCAHWDTRPTADEEILAKDRDKPILGADDGASGVAVLLELARIFHEQAPSVPVTIVLFDGEDFGPGLNDMLLGARYFASQLKGKSDYKYGILLDMIGQKKLTMYREGNSDRAAGKVNDKIWKKASDLGYADVFKDRQKYTIQDDHIPLIEAGLPCVDLIDFDYPYWHTLQDTPDKCSPDSLRVIGRTVAEIVYSEK